MNDELLNKILYSLSIIIILSGVIGAITSISGITQIRTKLKNRKNSYQKMDNEFNEFKNRIESELKEK